MSGPTRQKLANETKGCSLALTETRALFLLADELDAMRARLDVQAKRIDNHHDAIGLLCRENDELVKRVAAMETKRGEKAGSDPYFAGQV